MTYNPIWSIRVTEIDDNPYQARQDYGDISELADQIVSAVAQFPDTCGLMQPPHGRVVDAAGALVPVSIYARGGGDSHRVQLLYGHRRLRAFCHLAEQGDRRYLYMPLRLVDASDDMMLDAVWSENRNRRDLTAVEEARLMQSALTTLGISQRELADRWGLARPTVVNKLSLLSLPPDVQSAVQSGRISERAAQSLLPLLRLWEPVTTNWRGQSHSNPAAWFADTRSHYLPTPDSVLAYLTDAHNDETATSGNIREYVRRAIAQASEYLDDSLAAFGATQSPPVRQSTCQGCPLRWNDRCLDSRCLETRLAEMVQPVIERVSAETGLPISHDPACFSKWRDPDHGDILRQMWQTRSCSHLVVGWCLSEWAIRPSTHSATYRSWIPNDERLYTDLAAGVALGCTHGPRVGHCTPTQVAVAERLKKELIDTDPIEAMRPEWKSEDTAACRNLRRRAHDLVQTYLRRAAGGSYHPVGVLLWLKTGEYVPNEGIAADVLLSRYWPNSGVMSSYIYYHTVRQKCLELAALVGSDQIALLDAGQTDIDILVHTMRGICVEWAENRQYEYGRLRVRDELMPFLESVQPKIANYDGGDSRLTDLANWLERVHAEMAATATK